MANELKHKATAVSGKLAQTDYEATDAPLKPAATVSITSTTAAIGML
jgi:hypothetical protein